MHAGEATDGGGRDVLAAARLDEATAASVAATLQALATPSRLLILTTVRHAPYPVTEFAAAVGMEQSAVSHQLRLLRALGLLSGGDRQRVRIGQALATDPRILLCDEPLFNLDLHHQRAVTELVDARRRRHGTAVVFVTHEINPVLHLVDRVLYLAGGGHRVATPEEVLTSASLSQLYGTHVDVVRVHGRIVVVGAPDEPAAPPHHTHETDGVRP